MGIDEVIRPRREAILRLAASHGAEHVRVFGSMARGEARSDSDVDLLVRMKEGATLFDLIGLEQDLRDMLGRKVDVVTEGGVSRYLRKRIFSEAVVL